MMILRPALAALLTAAGLLAATGCDATLATVRSATVTSCREKCPRSNDSLENQACWDRCAARR